MIGGLVLLVGGIAIAGLSLAVGIIVWAVAVPVAIIQALYLRLGR